MFFDEKNQYGIRTIMEILQLNHMFIVIANTNLNRDFYIFPPYFVCLNNLILKFKGETKGSMILKTVFEEK